PRGSSPTSSSASRRPARSRHEPPDDGRGRGLTVGALAGLRLTRRGVAALVCAVALLALGGWASYPGLVGLGVALALALLAALVGVAVPVPVSVRGTVRPLRVPRLADCSATIVVRNTSTWLPVTAAGHDRVGGEELPFDLPRLVPGAA